MTDAELIALALERLRAEIALKTQQCAALEKKLKELWDTQSNGADTR